MQMCPALGICIPVGKDSMSMQTKWRQNDEDKQVTSPVSLIISAFAPVIDIAQTLTPELSKRPSRLILLELPGGHRRLGGAIIQQCFSQMDADVPDAPTSQASRLCGRCFKIQRCAPRFSRCTIAPMVGCSPP